MNWAAVHQLVPILHRNDAVGEHVIWLRERLLAAGVRSTIYVDVEDDATDELTSPLAQIERDITPGRTLFLYHVAQASRCAGALEELDVCRGVVFHNLTPSALLVGWDTSAASDMVEAQRQIHDLAPALTIGISDSTFNAEQLAEWGVEHHAVAPLPINFEVASEQAQRSPGHRPTVTFVGRVAPNKGFHDLVAAAAILRARIPEVEFRLVGAPTSERYRLALEGFVDDLDLADTVTFTGRVSNAALHDEYRRADVFCCLSDHEGFGVPLLEAMSNLVPVVAFDAAAVGETVGDAGIVLGSKEPAIVAAALERVLTDARLSDALVAAGRARVGEFTPDRAWERFSQALDDAWRLFGERQR